MIMFYIYAVVLIFFHYLVLFGKISRVLTAEFTPDFEISMSTGLSSLFPQAVETTRSTK